MNPLERAARRFELLATKARQSGMAAVALAHQDDADYCRNLSREQGGEVEALRERLLSDEAIRAAMRAASNAPRPTDELNTPLMVDLVVAAITGALSVLGSDLETHCHGRASEATLTTSLRAEEIERAIIECAEGTVSGAEKAQERLEALLAAFPNTEPSESCERCKGRGYLIDSLEYARTGKTYPCPDCQGEQEGAA